MERLVVDGDGNSKFRLERVKIILDDRDAVLYSLNHNIWCYSLLSDALIL